MRVNTDELIRQALELRRVAARIDDIEDSVQRVTGILCREQFGEQFRYPLNAAAQSVTARAAELNKMSVALQQISLLYEKAETRIIDEAESANVHHANTSFGLIRIPGFFDRYLWTTGPSYLRPIPVRPETTVTDAEPDVLVVDGLPTLDDIGWEEAIENVFDEPHNNVIPIPTGPVVTEEMIDTLRDAVIREPGRGWIPPIEIPVPDPIDLSSVFTNRSAGLRDLIGTGSLMDHADTILGSTGLIDWTPWEP